MVTERDTITRKLKTYEDPYIEEYQTGKEESLCKVLHTLMPPEPKPLGISRLQETACFSLQLGRSGHLDRSVNGRFVSRLRDTYFRMPDPSHGVRDP